MTTGFSATSPKIDRRGKNPRSLANLKPPWKPGQQPNPHPVGDYSITNRLKRKLALANGASADNIADTMIQTACLPNSRGYATALTQLLDRTEGKVKEPDAPNNQGTTTINILVTSENAKTLLDRVLTGERTQKELTSGNSDS